MLASTTERQHHEALPTMPQIQLTILLPENCKARLLRAQLAPLITLTEELQGWDGPFVDLEKSTIWPEEGYDSRVMSVIP